MLVFGKSYYVPIDAKTAWNKKNSNNDDQYTIGAFWYFLQNSDKPIGEYMRQADQQGFEKIQLLDKNKVLDYFTGKVNTVDQIDTTLINSTLIKPGKMQDVDTNIEELKGSSGRREDKALK